MSALKYKSWFHSKFRSLGRPSVFWPSLIDKFFQPCFSIELLTMVVLCLYEPSLSPLTPSMCSSNCIALLPGPSPLSCSSCSWTVYAGVKAVLHRWPMACGLLLQQRVSRTRKHGIVTFHTPAFLAHVTVSRLAAFKPKAANLLLCISAVPWPFYDTSTSSVRHCIIGFQTPFLCNSSFSAPQNICDGQSWPKILVLVNLGFSSSTVAVLSYLSGSILLGPVRQAAAPVSVVCCSTYCCTSCSTGLFSSILEMCPWTITKNTWPWNT